MQRFSPEHVARYAAYYAAQGHGRAHPHAWQAAVEQLAATCAAQSILDYGCGRMANLARYSALPILSYDPSMSVYAGEPEPADLVVCAHMLEHVEPEYVTAVLYHLWSLTRRVLAVIVSCEPSTKWLDAETPWHTFVKPAAWWEERFACHPFPGPVMPWAVGRPGREYAGTIWREQGTAHAAH